ncbi:protein of unknown function DUF1748 [Metschnikowia aff. pulcherrima]|uniref:Uncharacterized protein n=1 Tax=Metschnikowia aff. pulcherrima TaxID=2163413 RepID=A0A4P6XTB5_9ASCO|nr:protein of unknown function DUF1748 [Metschnikowia aff. pulcherrima]
MILAGVHRNTGLVLDTDRVSTTSYRRWLSKYLAIGEACYENFVSLLRVSGFFYHNHTGMEDESEPFSKQSQQSSS